MSAAATLEELLGASIAMAQRRKAERLATPAGPELLRDDLPIPGGRRKRGKRAHHAWDVRLPAQCWTDPVEAGFQESLETPKRKGLKIMSEKVVFAKNVWTEVMLKFPEGKLINNDYGESVMYSTVDGRVMFLPPLAAAQIKALQLAAGVPLAIRKTDVPGQSGRPIVMYEVKPVGNGTLSMPKEDGRPPSPEIRTASPAPLQAASNTSNGNASPYEHSGSALLLLQTTNMLSDALAAALNYAKKHDAVKPDDVRTLLVTAYIAITKKDGK